MSAFSGRQNKGAMRVRRARARMDWFERMEHDYKNGTGNTIKNGEFKPIADPCIYLKKSERTEELHQRHMTKI